MILQQENSTAGNERNFNDLAPAPRDMSLGSKIFLIFRYAWMGALFLPFSAYFFINPTRKNGTGSAIIYGIAGIVLVVICVVNGLKTMKYFINGKVTKAKMTAYNEYEERTRHGTQTCYNAEFTYRVNGIDYRRNLENRNKSNCDLVLDESEEPLLYLDNNPSKAMLIDEQGFKIIVNQLGNIEVKNAWAGYFFLLLFVLMVGLAVVIWASQI